MKLSNLKYASWLYNLTQGKEKNELKDSLSVFLQFLMAGRNLSRLSRIIELYKNLYNKKEGVTDVQIVSARPLAPEMTAFILQTISNAGPKAPQVLECQEYVNREILGGIAVKVGDDLVNQTLGGRLEQLQKQFNL